MESGRTAQFVASIALRRSPLPWAGVADKPWIPITALERLRFLQELLLRCNTITLQSSEAKIVVHSNTLKHPLRRNRNRTLD